MRIKPGFVIQDIEDVQFLVAVGTDTFNGLVRSNKTGAFIINCLREDTTEEEIVSAMQMEYDAPRELIAEDVRRTLETLRSIDAIEE